MAASRFRSLMLRGLAVLGIVFVLIQLIQPERTNPPVVSEIDAPPAVAAILERACYDCHSHETDWPWYAYLAPVSWWVVDHVNHGRGDLNFSDWPVLDFEALEHAFHDIDEQIAEDEMPLKSYRLLHPEARLTPEEKQTLRTWARSGG